MADVRLPVEPGSEDASQAVLKRKYLRNAAVPGVDRHHDPDRRPGTAMDLSGVLAWNEPGPYCRFQHPILAGRVAA